MLHDASSDLGECQLVIIGQTGVRTTVDGSKVSNDMTSTTSDSGSSIETHKRKAGNARPALVGGFPREIVNDEASGVSEHVISEDLGTTSSIGVYGDGAGADSADQVEGTYTDS